MAAAIQIIYARLSVFNPHIASALEILMSFYKKNLGNNFDIGSENFLTLVNFLQSVPFRYAPPFGAKLFDIGFEDKLGERMMTFEVSVLKCMRYPRIEYKMYMSIHNGSTRNISIFDYPLPKIAEYDCPITL